MPVEKSSPGRPAPFNAPQEPKKQSLGGWASDAGAALGGAVSDAGVMLNDGLHDAAGHVHDAAWNARVGLQAAGVMTLAGGALVRNAVTGMFEPPAAASEQTNKAAISQSEAHAGCMTPAYAGYYPGGLTHFLNYGSPFAAYGMMAAASPYHYQNMAAWAGMADPRMAAMMMTMGGQYGWGGAAMAGAAVGGAGYGGSGVPGSGLNDWSGAGSAGWALRNVQGGAMLAGHVTRAASASLQASRAAGPLAHLHGPARTALLTTKGWRDGMGALRGLGGLSGSKGAAQLFKGAGPLAHLKSGAGPLANIANAAKGLPGASAGAKLWQSGLTMGRNFYGNMVARTGSYLNSATNSVRGAVNMVKTSMPATTKMVGGAVEAGKGVVRGAADSVKGAVNTVKGAMPATTARITDAVNAGKGAATAGKDAALKAGQNVVGKVIGDTGKAGASATAQVTKGATTAVGAGKTAATTAINAGKGVATTAVNAGKGVVSSAVNAGKGIIGNVTGKVAARVAGNATLMAGGKLLGRLVPGLSIGIAALDVKRAADIQNDPVASPVKKAFGWITAGLAGVAAATSFIPGVGTLTSLGVGVAAAATGLVRDAVD